MLKTILSSLLKISLIRVVRSFIFEICSSTVSQFSQNRNSFDKPEGRVVDIEADYVCYDVPNEFIVGFWLDYDEKYRNLPYVSVLKEEIYTK